MRKRFVMAATTLAAVVPALVFAQARPAPAPQPRPATPPAQQPRPAAPPAQQPRPAAQPAARPMMAGGAHHEGTWELNAGVGMMSLDKQLSSSAFGFGGAVRAGYIINPNWDVSVGTALGSVNSNTLIQPFADLTYTMDINKKTSPFIMVGAGLTRISRTVGSVSSHITSTYGGHVGVGVRSFINDNLAWRLEGRMQYDHFDEIPSAAYNSAAMIGLSYFTGAKKVVTHIAVNGAPASLTSTGATARLSAIAHDQHGNAMSGKTFTWSSSNAAVARVDASGTVTAVSDGTAEITAMTDGVRGSTRVTVARAVNTVTVTPATGSLTALGRTQQFTAAGKDAGNQPVANAQFTWASSNPAVATVSPTGLATAVGAGTANITATANGKSASAALTVTQTVAAVAVTPATANVVAGATTQLTAAATDANQRPVMGKTFTWTSGSPAIATVSATGLVTGVAAGAARVTAAADGQTGASVVTVTSAAAPAAPPTPPVELPRVGASLVLRNVTFVANGATLTPASRTILDPIATAIVGIPNSHWEVGGYTDNRGAAAANRRLSQRRAQAVMTYLVSKGVPAGQLTAVGYGSANPARPNTTAANRAQNRRVEIKRVN